MKYDEQTFGLYMIFKAENNEIIAWKEGNRKECYLLRGENLEKYMDHLNNSIERCEKTLQIINNDYKTVKRMEKLKLYKKRLDNAISKINKEVAEIV